MAKEIKRKLHIGRVVITAVILIIIIILILAIVKMVTGGIDKGNGESNSYQQTTTTPITTTEVTTTVPANYEYQSVPKADIKKGELILVNNNTKFEGNEGEGLVSVYDIKTNSYMVKDTEVKVNSLISEHLNTMLDAFYNNYWLSNVMIISGYRSTVRQAELYQEDLSSTGLEYSTLVTKSGYSEHHTGLALDLGLYSSDWSSEYDGTGDYAWINENSYQYGFIVRYPSDKTAVTQIDYEPWHFRYVGQPHAYAIKEKSFCFEEYIDYLKQFTFESEHLSINSFDGDRYEIYYVPADSDTVKVPVPTDCEYTISGNNVDGFIITANRGTANPAVTDNLYATTAPPSSVISDTYSGSDADTADTYNTDINSVDTTTELTTNTGDYITTLE